jgi:hypothetical protein
VIGQFDDSKVPSYALLLVPIKGGAVGYRFLVFSRKSGQSMYEGGLLSRRMIAGQLISSSVQ